MNATISNDQNGFYLLLEVDDCDHATLFVKGVSSVLLSPGVVLVSSITF